ncbi:MAG: glycoside hydrolase family 3 protein [Treponema sp.]|nr:glycoside hydrolase family 3 protein [Treponema sp.]
MNKALTSLLVITSFLLFSCTSKAEKLQNKKEINNRRFASYAQTYIEKCQKENQGILEKYIKESPLEIKIAQLFVANLEGNKNFRSYETFKEITEGKGEIPSSTPLIAGGYLFFSYNLADSPEQQLIFMNSIKNYSSKNNQLNPYLSIDQEGGYVNRLHKLTGGLESQEKIAQKYSIAQAYNIYSDQAKKMNSLGFNMNIAPVLEISTDQNKDFLQGRSFGNTEQVLSYGKVCIRAYENNNIATVVKHFPGNTNTDPHTGLPEINLSKEELEESLIPFFELSKLQPSAILMSHARTSALDPQTPACLSKLWVTDIIRNKYNYQGLIFSDDIFMGALVNNGYSPQKAVIMAIEAGVDCIMTSEKRFGKEAKVLYQKASQDKAFEEKINQSFERIIKYKLKANIITYGDLEKAVYEK